MRKAKSNFKSKIHLCCYNDDYRSAMGCVYFKDGYAVATDSHMLLKQHLSLIGKEGWIEGLEGKLIHRKSFENILKSDFIEILADGIMCHFNGYDIMYPFATKMIDFPDYDKVFNQVKERGYKTPVYNAIGITPSILTQLSKAMYFDGIKQIKLTLPEHNTLPIVVTAQNIPKHDQIGLIMPEMVIDNY